MKQIYWDRSLINIIGSYLEYGEDGILNLLSYKYYNKNYKLHINAFILNDKMKEWYSIYCEFDLKIILYKWAAKYGYLNCMKYLHKYGYPWYPYKYEVLYDNLSTSYLKYEYKNGCPWDKKTCEYAVQYGHLDCLKYAHENGCPWDEKTCFHAALNGNLNCLKYAHENKCPYNINYMLFGKKCKEYIEKKMK